MKAAVAVRFAATRRVIATIAVIVHAMLAPSSAHADEPDAVVQDRPQESKATPAWKDARLGLTYDVRANVSLVAMPSQTFHLGGSCSTISGLAPVAIYGQQAREGGGGIGTGAGGRIGIMRRSAMFASSVVSWWGLRATLGLDANIYHERVPKGFRRVDGELCSTVAQTDHPVEYGTAVLLLTQPSLGLGPVIAFGNSDAARWRGVVLGLSWTPAVVLALASEGESKTYVNPLGVEVTVDFATIRSRANEPHFHLAWFIAPPTTDSRPAITTLSVGLVSY